jgi:uncharacterized protein (DUF2236 family)
MADRVARLRSASGADEFRDKLYLTGLGAVLAGYANVIMQLALPPIGYGVLESGVASGQLTRHPFKRFRTTYTYVAVAMLGTEDDRLRIRAAVDAVHRHVRSRPTSPVPYDARDPRLQLWVAACIYYGSVDLYTRMYGVMDEITADRFYRHAARFGTTLQLPESMWPANRAEFARYWEATVADTVIDDEVRDYLYALVLGRHLPRALRVSGRFAIWVTTGFLPQHFRDEMQFRWSPADERRFVRFMRFVGTVERLLPLAVRRFPFNALLWDVRWRAATGRPLV